MIDHFGILVSDIERSKEFYQRTLGPLGYEIKFDTPVAKSFRESSGNDPAGDFWIQPGQPVNIHFAFSADSRIKVDLFHRAGLDAGATDNGPPGIRANYHDHYYAAFLYDPDGYNIEAVCHTPIDQSI